MNTIDEQIQKLHNSIDIINQALEDQICGNTEKQTLFLAYFDIANEHIHSIYFLIQNSLNGSALALVRPFYETIYRALWMYAFATDDEVTAIRNGKFKFKNMGSKIKELDSFYTGNDFFTKMKKGTWEIMSDYTHSGTCQLSRRWTGDVLVSNYSENEILEVLIETRKALILFSYTLIKMHGYNENKILSLYFEEI